MRKLPILLLVAIAGLAQTGPAYQPQYIIGAGVAYDYYGHQPAALTTLALKVADATYSLTTMETGIAIAGGAASASASLRTGVMRLLAQPGNWTLFGLGDAGITVSSGATLGNFSGGFGLAYDVGAKLKSPHIYLTGIVRLLDITSTQVKPVYEFEIGKTF